MKTILMTLAFITALIGGTPKKPTSHNVKGIAYAKPIRVNPASLNVNYDHIVGEIAKIKTGNSYYKIAKVEKLYEKGEGVLYLISYVSITGNTSNVAYLKKLKLVNNHLEESSTNDKIWCSGDCDCSMSVTVGDNGSTKASCDPCGGHCQLNGTIGL